jgi:hypothetical protein
MTDKDVMDFQNHTNSKMEDPCGEPDPTSCDAIEAVNIKVEEVSDTEEEVGHIKVEEVSDSEEEVGPVPIIPEIKTEPEVRCTTLYVDCKKQSCLCTWPWRPIGLRDDENRTFSRQLTHRWW